MNDFLPEYGDRVSEGTPSIRPIAGLHDLDASASESAAADDSMELPINTHSCTVADLRQFDLTYRDKNAARGSEDGLAVCRWACSILIGG